MHNLSAQWWIKRTDREKNIWKCDPNHEHIDDPTQTGVHLSHQCGKQKGDEERERERERREKKRERGGKGTFEFYFMSFSFASKSDVYQLLCALVTQIGPSSFQWMWVMGVCVRKGLRKSLYLLRTMYALNFVGIFRWRLTAHGKMAKEAFKIWCDVCEWPQNEEKRFHDLSRSTVGKSHKKNETKNDWMNDKFEWASHFRIPLKETDARDVGCKWLLGRVCVAKWHKRVNTFNN